MLVELIPKIAAMEAAERGEESREYYPRPSQSGPERCTRQMYYHRRKLERTEANERMWLIFDDSSWHEELTADWIRKTQFKLHSEQMEVDLGRRITGYNWNIQGKIDGILQDLLGIERLWENKAINHFSFERYWNADYGDLEAIPWDNICQSCIYCNSLQQVQPEIREILLVIKNKNTAQFIEYLIEYHREYDVALIKELTHSTGEKRELNYIVYFPVEYCIDKFEQIENYWRLDLDLEKDAKFLPKREYEMDEWRCEYCPYGDECWKGFIGEMNKLQKGVEILEQDIADAAAYYLELNAQLKDLEDEKDKLKKWVKASMLALEAGEGMAGPYKITLKGTTSLRVDKSLIPDVILHQVTKKYYSDTLRITKPQTKEEKAAKAKEKREQKKREKAKNGSSEVS